MSSIEEAEARIGQLRAMITEQQEIVDAGKRVIPVLSNWKSQFSQLVSKSSSASTATKNTTENVDSGKNCFAAGACNMGQSVGNSQTFETINSMNGELEQAVQSLTSTISESQAHNDGNLQTAITAKEAAEGKINAYKNEISSLEAWIEEELRRQEEEANSGSN